MRIAVVGAGSVGGYYGSLLQRSEQDVVFIARGAHLEAMRSEGLRVESVLGPPDVQKVLAAGQPAEVGPVDLVLFAVKSYDTASAAAALQPLVGAETVVLTLQNGVDNVDVLS
ncbi:MAG TPA: 2-dehydropantoate 2-reductase N-terminal domain-containing protein, partial [bacterium]